ncbi:hypothetical protein CYMTET_13663 [Cymbomonas tetramitiformis]|uniref:Uncharacterized protein n=1 Tax=Cymbomonas tetramitiformis TaxID=36881 RepID=A0AAE0GHY8_9CHLO|nr:hypothetical protein CYMTET_13663 [Cymbomonas tetramitiformis]
MRASAQVSGAGAAERGHTVMNMVETKTRNRMHGDDVESWMHIIHNSKQVGKRTTIEYRDQQVIAWTEGHEDNEACQDAWQAEDDEQQQARVAASESRASNIARASHRRVLPVSEDQVITSFGRVVRGPQILE